MRPIPMTSEIPRAFDEIEKTRIRGMVRELDTLNRIVIPSEYRHFLGIDRKEQLEMYLLNDGVFIRKKKPVAEPAPSEAT